MIYFFLLQGVFEYWWPMEFKNIPYGCIWWWQIKERI